MLREGRIIKFIDTLIHPHQTELQNKQAAIDAWENDPEIKPKNLKVVRGEDGLAVEVSLKQELYTFKVNGQQKQYTDNDLDVAIANLCLEGIFDQAYEIRSLKGLHYDKKKIFYVLTGVPSGMPAGLLITR